VPQNRTTIGAVALAAIVPVLAAVVAVVTLTATDAPSTSSAASGGAGGGGGGGGDAIVIRNFTFEPTPLVVKAGTTVVVTNADDTRHSVTADKGSFDTHDLDGGGRATFVLDKPGTYAYHCDIHDYMKGTIEVRG
jgi:plastocyanin